MMDPRPQEIARSGEDPRSIIVDESAFRHEDEDPTRVFESPVVQKQMDGRMAAMVAEFSKRERTEALNELRSMIEDHAAELSEDDEDLPCLEAALEAIDSNDPETARTWLQNLDESPKKGMMLGQLATWEKKLREAN